MSIDSRLVRELKEMMRETHRGISQSDHLDAVMKLISQVKDLEVCKRSMKECLEAHVKSARDLDTMIDLGYMEDVLDTVGVLETRSGI